LERFLGVFESFRAGFQSFPGVWRASGEVSRGLAGLFEEIRQTFQGAGGFRRPSSGDGEGAHGILEVGP
jgi:hypothetical protein